MHQLVDMRGLTFEVELLDIQQLNARLFAGDFDVAKTSFHAALHLAAETVVLPSGSALGYKVGPLLLSASADAMPSVDIPDGSPAHYRRSRRFREERVAPGVVGPVLRSVRSGPMRTVVDCSSLGPPPRGLLPMPAPMSAAQSPAA